LRVQSGWQGGVAVDTAMDPIPMLFQTSILNGNLGYGPENWKSLFSIGLRSIFKLSVSPRSFELS
jgi:hypothetical protein